MVRIAKGFLFLILLVLLGACASPRLGDHAGPGEKPPILACLDSPLVRTATRLAEEAPEKNHVELLEIGDEALLARIHLIRSACASIEIQTMIWANDETGRLIMFELIQAARRGVKVRLLIDHVASEQHIEIANFLGYVNPNFEIRLYNPVTGLFGQLKAEPTFFDKLYAAVFKFDRTNRRMHNKTFIIDGLIGITGGRNYQNAYYDRATRMNYKDRDILAIGPVVRQMHRSFDRYWKFKRSVELTDLVDVQAHHEKGIFRNWHSRESFELNGIFGGIDRDANRPELIAAKFVAPLRGVEAAEFIADDPQQNTWSTFRDNGRSKVTEELAALIARARESVYIQTPYLVLTSPAIKLFKRLRKNNPEIDLRISTNSLAATDSWYVYALSYKQKKTYLDDLGFKIYEFKPLPGDMERFMPNYVRLRERGAAAHRERLAQAAIAAPVTDEELSPGASSGPPKAPYFCLHAKSMVVDDRIAFVGSYNLDPRSENINTECGLVLKDAGLAEQLKRNIAVDMAAQNAWVIAKKDLPEGIDLANEALTELSALVPLIDLWPFRNTASFELKDGRAPVETDHPEFYRNYRDVGSFPQVRGENLGKEIGVHGTKTFLGVFKPLL